VNILDVLGTTYLTHSALSFIEIFKRCVEIERKKRKKISRAILRIRQRERERQEQREIDRERERERLYIYTTMDNETDSSDLSGKLFPQYEAEISTFYFFNSPERETIHTHTYHTVKNKNRS
jgi:hypothetical protein